jgi:quinolinate synthase
VTLSEKIRTALDAISPRPLVLAHHYQRDGIVELADHRGDSLELARRAAESGGARDIIFCGVNFMAETARILVPRPAKVYMHDESAGCPLAGMASLPAVAKAWDKLAEAGMRRVIPITYINSSAALKAFCARHGGAVCTSSNAAKVLAWALSKGKSVFFFPDRNLGENTALSLGIEALRIVPFEPDRLRRGNHMERLAGAKVVLWPGFCPIHKVMTAVDVARVRRRIPCVRVIVHPECPHETVAAADEAGSTSRIIAAVMQSPAGSAWAVGTEVTLVRRLAREAIGRRVVPLRDSFCRNMAKGTLPALHRLVTSLRDGRPVPEIRVDAATARWARKALDRMLELA